MEISKTLLRANCFPAGMELFPAADEEQFEYIKKVVRQSDFYIIVSAGKYGTISPKTGLGYTEMEYDYAVEIGIPVIRLLHRDPVKHLPNGLVESTPESRELLERFRQKMQTEKLVNHWMESSELPSLALLNLNYVISAFPTSGWSKFSKKMLPDSCVAQESITLLEIIRDNASLKIHEILNLASEELDIDMRNFRANRELKIRLGILMNSGLVVFRLDMKYYSASYDDSYEFWRYEARSLPCRITESGKEVLRQNEGRLSK